MPLIQLTTISHAYGMHALLNDAQFQLDAGERVGLLGRNGEGKSTLMKIIAGQILPDSGEIWRQPGLKIAWLEQSPELNAEDSVYDAVAAGLGDVGQIIMQYHHLLAEMGDDERSIKALGDIQQQLEAADGWDFQQRVESTLSKLGLPADDKIGSLSGGWQRRVALARALVIGPDLLLLDEPTNHLDFETIGWLEKQMLGFKGAVLFVTHDRSFLQKLATRIVDLDRGRLQSWAGGYADYLLRKEAALRDETNQNALFDKNLAKEETWVRQGIKARRTRNEGRVRALKKLRSERAARRDTQGSARLTLDKGEASGKKVIVADDVSFQYQNETIISHFSALVERGDKIGLLGPNGCGKSTLLKLLLKQIEPSSGTVEQGTRLQVAYFDQLRVQLDPEETVADTVADGNEFLEIGGVRRHVMSYLSDFLFAPARARSPVKSLSGGEKNRLLLARLFTKSANLIIMDEPTNDLDLETLEILEEKLVNYAGTLLLVSHDRTFLDNVVSSVFVFEGAGIVNEYIGGYSDWFRYAEQTRKIQMQETQQKNRGQKTNKTKPNATPKLGYKEQRELEQLPDEIDKLETRQATLGQEINDPEFYQNSPDQINQKLAEIKAVQEQLKSAYLRWEELD